MVFLIMYWPTIKLRCKRLENDAVIKFRYKKCFEPCKIFPCYYTTSDKITQTSTYKNLIEDETPDEHTFLNNRKECCCLYAHEYYIKRNIPYRHDYTVIFKSSKSCCSLNKANHEKCSWIPNNSQANLSNFNGDRTKLNKSHCTNGQTNHSTSNTTYFGWSPELLVKIKAQTNTSDSKSITAESPDKNSCDGEYIYDDYNDCHYEANSEDARKIAPSQSQSTKFPEDAEERSSTSLLDKVAKIGWTYTPPKDTEINPHASVREPAQLMDKNVCEAKYNLYFDDVVEERKDIGQIHTFSESTEILSEPPPELQSSLSQSRKSLIKIPRIKSRFGFLRMLSPKASMLQKSTSTSDVSSAIKYKKMN